MAAGGAAASTVENSVAPGESTGRRVTGACVGGLVAEGPVRRARVTLAPGSVASGDRGNIWERARLCLADSARLVGTGSSVACRDTGSLSEGVRCSSSGSVCEHDAADGKRARARLDAAVEA